jgi:hypothetical protein
MGGMDIYSHCPHTHVSAYEHMYTLTRFMGNTNKDTTLKNTDTCKRVHNQRTLFII